MRPRLLAVAVLVTLLASCTASEPPVTPTSAGSTSSLRDLITPGVPRWRQLPDAPLPRQQAASAQIGDRIYVIGGLTAKGVTDRVDTFDVVAHVWSVGPAYPLKVSSAMAVAFDSSVFVLGGFGPNGKPVRTVYRLVGKLWVPVAPLRRARADGAAAVAGDQLYVFGGRTNTALVRPSESFTAGAPAWTDAPPIPTPRFALAAATQGTKVYLSGGSATLAPADTGALATFEQFDASTRTWLPLRDVPTRRRGSASVVFRGKIALFGGEAGNGAGQPVLETSDEFDPARGFWIQSLPGMFRAKHDFVAISSGGNVYVLIGGSRSGLAPSATCEELVTS